MGRRPRTPPQRDAAASDAAVSDAAGLPFLTAPARSVLPPAPRAPAPPAPAPPAPGPALPVAPAAPGEPAPHYHQHRERLRDRFVQSGAEALADYELLELLLFRVIPRRDTKPIAKALIARFGDLSEVLAAPQSQLATVDGVGPAAALELKAVQAAVERVARAGIRQRNVLTSWTHLTNYLRAALQNETREQFRVLFLDRKNFLMADEVLGKGTVDHAPVYPREIMRRALELGAASLILVHNHPSGDPTPSAADVAVTRDIVKAAATLEITVHDHVVVGRNGVASFKSLGLL